MSRIFCLVYIFLLSAIETLGQCANPPFVALSSTRGNTCVTSPITVSGTFGGSTKRITISDNGAGSVSPEKSSTSPFTFTYTPNEDDMGKEIHITITTNDPPGKSCTKAQITYVLNVNESPSAPERGRITQPTCLAPTGSVVLNGLPAGTWTITRSPGGSKFSGTGTTTTVSGLGQGKYNFSVTNSAGCISSSSADVIINSPPSAQTLKITDPASVCFPSTVDITAPSVTSGSGPGLTYTYWRNSDATVIFNSPTAATEGTYYIKGTSASTGCFDIKPVTVRVEQKPDARAGPDQELDNLFETKMDALEAGPGETGSWSVISGSGLFSDSHDESAVVSDLSPGRNIFAWTLSDKICPPSSDSVIIMVKVNDPVLPSLITPNMDGRNDYFIVTLNERMGKTELVVFDRSGIQVYKNMDYDNRWNGVDYNGDPLPDGTYFYVVKPGYGKSLSGFIVIQR